MTVEEQKQDEEIRAKYNFIRKAESIDDQGKKHVAYFKAPNRLIVGIAMSTIDSNTLLACEYIFDDAVIKEVSDVAYFRDNDDVFIGLVAMLQALIRVKKSTFTT